MSQVLGSKTINKTIDYQNLAVYHRAWRYVQNETPTVTFFCLWFLLQVLIFGFAFVNYAYNSEFSKVREALGTPFLLARGTSLPIEINTALILLPMCRSIISLLRSTPLNHVIPFDKSKTFHKMTGWCILFFSVTHSFAHYTNFYLLQKQNNISWFKLTFATGPGITGNIMLVALLAIVFTSLQKIRRNQFEVFWYTHHLFALYFFCYSFHGGFCLIKRDHPPYCSGASFWKYWTFSGVLYLFERLLREWRGSQKTYITRVVLHPSKVVEVQFKKDYFNMKAGQYIFLCCPEVSLHQWHPFTLTFAPEDDYISVHIRMAGNFTREFAKRLGCDVDSKTPSAMNPEQDLDRTLPSIMIDGPFGSASEDVFNYEVSVLVGAGIGVTPFASILRSIWYRLYTPSRQTRLSKVYFFWICRDKEAFEWFQSLMSVIEQEDTSHIIEINTYLTGKLKGDEIRNLALHYEVGKEDALTGLRAHTHYGRPNFGKIFSSLTEKHRATDIGVFFCGPKPLGKSLHLHCTQYSQSGVDGTRFHYGKENF